MERQEFESLLIETRRKIGGYDDAYDVVDKLVEVHGADIDVREMKDDIISRGRWTVTKEMVFGIAGKYYVSVVWNSPASEMQDGQETNCEIYEVEPYEKTIVEYRVIEKEIE